MNTSSRARQVVTIATCAAVAAGSALSALAQTAPRGTKPSLKPLTRAELRECMNREDRLKARQGAMQKDQAAHDAILLELAQQAIAMADEQRTIDVTDQKAIDDFNARVEARNRRVEAQNERALEANRLVIELNREAADFTTECSARTYHFKDKEAIEAERNRAAGR
jgi:hypothetical protein